MADRYQYAMEQKMNQDQYYSLGTFFVGIILSIFGFFGYKSIKSIEEKANHDAERAAKQTSEDVTKNYLDERLQGKVSIAAEKIFNSMGAETMKAKVVEETIKHDDVYIDTQLSTIKADLMTMIQTKSQNEDEPIEQNSPEPGQATLPSDENDDMFK